VKVFIPCAIGALIAFIILAIVTERVFGNAIGKEFGPVCTVGFNGDHAKDAVTFRGWDAQSACQTEIASVPGAFYNHQDAADQKALTVCNIDSPSIRATVRDKGSIGTDDFTLCDDIRSELR
jgi:hypothetical protein